MPNIAINGFGRIGRQAFKVAVGRPDLTVVAINDLTDTRTLAHLLKYDTSYGLYDKDVDFDLEHLIVDHKKYRVFAEKDPSKLPWKDFGVDVVLECTGRFTSEESAKPHLVAGAKKVIISAPAKGGVVPTYILGVNDDGLDTEKATVMNNGSCTTNCISPVMKVLEERFGIEKAMMTTVHGYTADQNLQDGPHKDLRRARAAAENIVPTTTGAAISTTEAIPTLRSKFDGLAIRVPVPNVSLSDLTVLLKKDVTVDEVNHAFIDAATDERYAGIISVIEEELVSSDLRGDSSSAIIDLLLTKVVGGNLVKVVAWYDNEVGYAHRLVELAERICSAS
jgi:glyceraldehyde 3-phosphate dehydrogenase